MTTDPFDGGRRDPSTQDPPGAGREAGSPAIPPRDPPTRRPLAVPLAPTAPRPPAGGRHLPGPRRADDRRVAAASIGLAAAFLLAAVLAALAAASGAAVLAPWLPLHLALAGGASTAIAGVMPFFVAALAAGRPADARLRGGAVGLVAAGAALIAVRGVVPSVTWAPVVGGCLYLAGIGSVALALRASGRAGLMVRRPIVTWGYTLALGNVGLGGLLGTLAVAGWPPVLERWAQLRPAHAWTNLIGFVSLVIVATLLHFLPTVLGTRIVPRRSAAVAVIGLAIGSPVVVLGLATGAAPVAGGGAVVAVFGAAATAVEALRVVRDRGRWTSDPGWHRFASVGLLAGVTWFVIGVAEAAALVIVDGATGDAWSTALVGGPLVVGWITQVLMASWTHLLPSIGPGGPVEHARQRAVLGRLATVRLLALNGGVALLAVGAPAAIGWAVGVGGVLSGGSALATVALTALALRAGR